MDYITKVCNYNKSYFYDFYLDKLNIKEAIDFIADAWNNVTQTTIRNCWMKTGILPNSDDAIMVDANIQDPKFDDSMNVINTFPDASGVNEYLDSFDQNVPAEEYLNDEQIINLVQFEKEANEEDNDTSDEEIPLVSAKQAVNGLKTFIQYFEQQNNDSQFNTNELYIFRKYFHIVKVKETNSKRQGTLDNFLNN